MRAFTSYHNYWASGAGEGPHNTRCGCGLRDRREETKQHQESAMLLHFGIV